jgi:hypothetical protein
MAPPTNRDGYRAYADLRALMNELLDAPDETGHDEAMTAIRVWLRTHCATCGTVVERSARRPDPLSPTCWECDIGDLMEHP